MNYNPRRAAVERSTATHFGDGVWANFDGYDFCLSRINESYTEHKIRITPEKLQEIAAWAKITDKKHRIEDGRNGRTTA